MCTASYISVHTQRDIAGRTRRTSLRAYSGDGHVLRGGAGNSAADSIEMIRFDGGYFDADLVPHYYIADYLGSNIAVVDADGDLVQTATYYPYGEPHRDPLIRRGIYVSAPPTADAATAAEPRTANPYLYGDKEWMYQDGLREYVYGARMHVPSLPRFTSIDPSNEAFPDISQYCMCHSNPIIRQDPTGMTDFVGTSMCNHIFVNDNIHQVLQIDDDIIEQLENTEIDPNSQEYKNLLKKGTIRNDLLPTIYNVNGKEYVGYGKYGDCLKAAKAQNNCMTEIDPSLALHVYGDVPEKSTLLQGINYVVLQLKEGKSVIVGVNYSSKQNRYCYNKSTNHFINIVGMGFDLLGNYFSYYDNAPNNKSKGADLRENRIYIDSIQNPTFAIDSSNLPIGNVLFYRITEIRKNK